MTKTAKWLIIVPVLLLIAYGFIYAGKRNAALAPSVPVAETPADTASPSAPASTVPAAAAKNPLLGTEWVWGKTTFGAGMANPVSGSTATITPAAGKFVATFGADMHFSSTTDCNSLMGKYIVDGEVLSLGPVATTKMACPAGNLESEYTKELGRAASYVIAGNELHVNLVKDTGTMVFTKRVKAVDLVPAAPAVNLNGSTFRLASFNGAPISAESKYTLSFTDKNLSAKFCNGLGGTYSLSKGVLQANTVGTLMYCESPANLMKMEQSFASALGTGATLVQDGSTLTITGSKGDKFVYTVFMD